MAMWCVVHSVQHTHPLGGNRAPVTLYRDPQPPGKPRLQGEYARFTLHIPRVYRVTLASKSLLG